MPTVRKEITRTSVVVMSSSAFTLSTAKASTLKGYRSTSDIKFDLDTKSTSDLGWVIFETRDGHSEGQGVIGTFNNVATLELIRFERTQKLCRIRGWFTDGQTGATRWLLDDVAFTSFFVRDANGLISFRAGIIIRHP